MSFTNRAPNAISLGGIQEFRLIHLLPSHLGPGFGPASATSSQSRSCLLCSMQVGTRDVRDQPFLRIPGKDLAEARENQLHQARKPTAVQEVKA